MRPVGDKSTGKAKTAWFSALLADAGLGSGDVARHASNIKALDQLFEHTVSELNSADFEFQLLLPQEREPEDDTDEVDEFSDSGDIDTRLMALATWCRGFCMGVAGGDGTLDLAGISFPADTQELLQDFSAIADSLNEEDQPVGTDDDEFVEDEPDNFLETDTDEDEHALVELIEYVRMGVILINEELRPTTKQASQAPDQLH